MQSAEIRRIRSRRRRSAADLLVGHTDRTRFGLFPDLQRNRENTIVLGEEAAVSRYSLPSRCKKRRRRSDSIVSRPPIVSEKTRTDTQEDPYLLRRSRDREEEEQQQPIGKNKPEKKTTSLSVADHREEKVGLVVLSQKSPEKKRGRS
ncbi:hypothetical protein MRB53_026026 [Persea americana]|uniref:Uncharacterized protein n=1 Tax=Persea americana TaxID=3435 RepID=A0ACC2LHF2_PERAE|nr:hypothetical protein MRB53_026026 [Persea americana]